MLMDKKTHVHVQRHADNSHTQTHMQIIRLGPRTEVPKANSGELTHTPKCLTP